MSDQQPTETPSPVAISLKSDVATIIANSGAEVRKRVVDALVEKELNERVELLSKGLVKRDQAFQEVCKVNKPDQSLYDADGEEVQSLYSSVRLKELKEAKEKLANIDAALAKALNTPYDFEKLKKLCG